MKVVPKSKKQINQMPSAYAKGVGDYSGVFSLSALALSAFMGLWIQGAAVAGSPLEFVVRGHYTDSNHLYTSRLRLLSGIWTLVRHFLYNAGQKRKATSFDADFYAAYVWNPTIGVFLP